MTHIISNLDETKFITLDSFGKFTWTTSKSKANRYIPEKAQNVIDNCLTKPTTSYKVIEYIGEPTKENAETAVDAIKHFSKTKLEDCDWDKELEFDVVTTAIQYRTMLRDLENEKVKLNNQLIILSRAMVDLYHYKEMNPKLSAVNICRMHKFEVGVLHKRRECKDRLFFVDKLLEEISGKDVKGDIENFLDMKSYRVRVLEELFKSGNVGDFDGWFDEVMKGRGHENKRVSSDIE